MPPPCRPHVVALRAWDPQAGLAATGRGLVLAEEPHPLGEPQNRPNSPWTARRDWSPPPGVPFGTPRPGRRRNYAVPTATERRGARRLVLDTTRRRRVVLVAAYDHTGSWSESPSTIRCQRPCPPHKGEVTPTIRSPPARRSDRAPGPVARCRGRGERERERSQRRVGKPRGSTARMKGPHRAHGPRAGPR